VDAVVTKGTIEVSDIAGTSTEADRPLAEVPSVHRLRAGEATSFDSGSGRIEVHHVGASELQRRIAWRQGYLAFAGEPLSEVVTQINRYSATTLEIGDPKLASVAIGGRFKIGDLDAVLDLLNTTLGVHAHRVSDRNIRLEPEPGH
jgi:transmembrane sensor